MSQQVQQQLRTLVTAMTTLGTNTMTSLAAAITAGESQVVNAIVQAAIAAATSALKIGSPSTVSAYWADMTIAGLVDQIDAGESNAVSSMKDTFSAAVDTGQKVVATAGPMLDSAMSASIGKSVLVETRASVMQVGGGSVGGNSTTTIINGYPNASASQLADEVSYRMRTARRGVHSRR